MPFIKQNRNIQSINKILDVVTHCVVPMDVNERLFGLLCNQ